MCTVCGCGDVVTLDGRKVSHDEAHRFGLAHHHPAPSGGLHHYGLGAAGVSVPGMRTPFGGQRIVDMLVGEQLPRIC